MLYPLFSVTEQLESRRLLSGDFASLSSHGTLSVVGTSKNDTIVVQYKGSKVQAILNGKTLSFNKSSVKRFWIESFGGDDRITNTTDKPSTMIGDAGNDTFVGGSGDDSINAGSGDDHFDGGLGTNQIDGGSGNDAFDYSSESGSKFFLRDYATNSFFDAYAIVVTRNDSAGTDYALQQSNLRTFIATSGDDTVEFYLSSYAIAPYFKFYLGDGNDTGGPSGGAEALLLDGGNGNDTLGFNYDTPIESVLGGAGDDTILDNAGYQSTYIDGGSGFDSDIVNPDQPVLTAPSVDYTVPAGIEKFSLDVAQDLIVHGNDLDNTIDVGAGNVTVYGNAGNDTIHASAPNFNQGFDETGHVLLDGGAGNDLLHASATLSATVKGGTGNDTLIGDGNLDGMHEHPAVTFQGYGGIDTADFSERTENLSLSLDNNANDGAAGEKSNILADVENITGGGGADRIVGNPFDNLLKGNGGNDTIYGGSGNDTLDGGSGHDHLYGQDGNDTFFAKDGSSDSLDGGSGSDKASRDAIDSVTSIESFI